MKPDDGLQRLISAARRGRMGPDAQPPFGFATRVAARALAPGERSSLHVWERAGRIGVAFAVLACIATAALYQRSPQSEVLAELAGINERSAAGAFW